MDFKVSGVPTCGAAQSSLNYRVGIMIWLSGVMVIALVGHCAGSNVATFSDIQFDVEPRDVVAVKDSVAILECSVRSLLTVEIDWIKDGIPLTYDSRRYKLQNGSLYFEAVEHSRLIRPDEGAYQCVVRTPTQGTIISRKARLRVAYMDRTFIDEPQNLAVHLGDGVMFSCQINGLPVPEVRWFKDDVELETKHSNYVLHVDNVLELQNVHFSDFGRYKCRASNKDRTKMSRVGILTQDVDATTYQGVLPRFIAQPQDAVTTEGNTIVLHCGANGRDRNGARPRIQWLKDGATIDLTNADNHLTLEGQGSLRIDGVQEQDAGSYTCRAINHEDSIDSDAMLTVQVPPKFQWRPKSLAALISTDVELQCDSLGIPKPTIDWLKDSNTVIPGPYIQISEGRNLRILGVLKSDEGMYQCIATNNVGMIQAFAQLVIFESPSQDEIVSQSQMAPASSPSDLRAIYVSSRFVTLSWRDERPAAAAGYLIYWREKDSTRQRLLNTSYLEANIRDLKSRTKYDVQVKSFNENGRNSIAAEITVETMHEESVPGPPANLRPVPTSSTSIYVSWDPAENSSDPITYYKLFYYNMLDSSAEMEFIALLDYTVTGLLKFNKYVFRVIAFNKNGPGASSDEMTCQTYSDVPSLPPQNVSVEAVSSSSIVINWQPPPEGAQNGIITGYKIRYKNKQRGEKSGTTVTAGGNLRTWELNGLERAIEYNIRIQALTVNGSGPASSWFSTETFPHDLDESTVPGKPTSLKVRSYLNWIAVSWTSPVEQDIMIRGYILGYGVGVPDSFSQILDSKMRTYTIRGLKPASEYVISLKAYNTIGEGIPIYETTTTREDTTPEPTTPMMPPVGLKAIVYSSTSILLTWSDNTLGRSQRITDNRYYTVRYTTKVSTKYKMTNSTDLSLQVEELKADTEYEFSVRVTRGTRQSTWSLSVFNRTKESVPSSSPRDITPVAIEGKSTIVTLNWQPPRHTNGQITEYHVYYTTDATEHENEWIMEGARGDSLSVTIKDLTLETTYYFKVRARNSAGLGPMSPTVIFRTPRLDGSGGGVIVTPDDFGAPGVKNLIKNTWTFQKPHEGSIETDNASGIGGISNLTLWIIIGCISGFLVVAVPIVIAVFCCRRQATKDATKKENLKISTKTKFSQRDLNPPDLWLHETVELTNVDRENSDDNIDEIKELQMPASNRTSISNSASRYKSLSPTPMNQETTPGEKYQSYQGIAKVLPRDKEDLSSMRSHSSASNSTPRVNAGDITQSKAVRHVRPMVCASNSLNKSVPPVLHSPNRPSPTPLRTPNVSKIAGSLNTNRSSTDELTAEMENLEGLMKDLTVITQQQFDC